MSRQHRDRLHLKTVMVLVNQKGHIHDALGLVTLGLNVLQTTDVKQLVQEETHRRNHRTLVVLSNRTSRYYVWVIVEHDKFFGKPLCDNPDSPSVPWLTRRLPPVSVSRAVTVAVARVAVQLVRSLSG